MKYIVYFPEEREVIVSDPEDFLPEDNVNMEELDSLSGRTVYGVCLYEGVPYNNAVLLQVVGDNNADATVSFMRRVIFEKTKNPEKLKSLIRFNALCIKRQTFPPFKMIKTDTEPEKEKAIDVDVESSEASSSDESEDLPPLRERVRKEKASKKSEDHLHASEDPERKKLKVNLERSCPAKTMHKEIRDQRGQFSGYAESAMRRALREKKVEIRDEATFILLCKVLDRQNDIMNRLRRLEQQRESEPIVDLPLPLFRTEEDLSELHPDISKWMIRVGGSNAREFVYRALGKLLTPELQRKINRSGTVGKIKFPAALEKVISDCALQLYPACTKRDIEMTIVRFFKNANDRFGGYSRRGRHSSGPQTSSMDQ